MVEYSVGRLNRHIKVEVADARSRMPCLLANIPGCLMAASSQSLAAAQVMKT